MSVSYTHLDVYKRQLRTTPESLDETLPLCSDDQRFVPVMDGRVDNWEELRCDLLKRGARPVSYTHLDVYKRQDHERVRS